MPAWPGVIESKLIEEMMKLIARGFFWLAIIVPLTACSTAGIVSGIGKEPPIGMVVVYALAPDAAEKEGVAAVTEQGGYVFRSTVMDSSVRGTMSFGEREIPATVRVTWRKDTENRRYWDTGTIGGDYTIPIRSRIPDNVLRYIREKKGRALVLQFRVKDNGVLLAWKVRDTSPAGAWVYALHGGEFRDATIFNGKVIDPGWERPQVQ